MPEHALTISTPAKINLFLKVTGKRADGYHELCSLMCPLDLHDTIHLDLGAEGISISCDQPDLPEDESNLAARAAVLFFEALEKETSVRHPGVAIRLEKNIPIAAGLGGGSSNAAGVINALNAYFGQLFPVERLMSMGLRIGADVPFFIHGKPAVATGIGERLKSYSGLRDYPVLLACPDIPVSTAWVYKNLKYGLTKPQKQLNYQHFDGLRFDVGKHLANDLEAVTAGKHGVIKDIKRYLLSSGALGSLMSGSGPSVFGLYDDEGKALAAKENFPEPESKKIFLTKLLV